MDVHAIRPIPAQSHTHAHTHTPTYTHMVRVMVAHGRCFTIERRKHSGETRVRKAADRNSRRANHGTCEKG